MSDPHQAEPVTSSAEPQATTAPSGEPATQAEAALLAALDTAQREAAELKDKLLRTLAEMENLRRRTEREVADARTYGVTGFARDVLAVADNMHRALEAVDPASREAADPKIKALIEGVELTERELHKSLEKNGVRKFSPLGEKFDPNFHQAMFEMQSPDLPPGSVGQVFQAGYMIGERVLRPAMVGVVKAAPKAAQANDNTVN
jgi:molecular chaperone GrpE